MRENALRIVQQSKPLFIKKVASVTEFPLELASEGVAWSDKMRKMKWKKAPKQRVKEIRSVEDLSHDIANYFQQESPDFWVTAGAGNASSWKPSGQFQTGEFFAKRGKLTAVDMRNRIHHLESPHPKILLALGESSTGLVKDQNALALTYMNRMGVHQMIGSTTLSWFGYGVEGIIDYFVEHAGRYSFAESFLANQIALIHQLETEYPKLARKELKPGTRTPYSTGGGLLFDRDTAVFYGDPAWQVRMMPVSSSSEQILFERDGRYTFQVIPNRKVHRLQLVSSKRTNRGMRPIIHWFPHRLKNVRITQGKEFQPVITDNFILVPQSGITNSIKTQSSPVIQIQFVADRMKK